MPNRIAQLQSLLKAEPGDTFCMYGLAMEYAKIGEAAQALDWFDRVIDADADYLYAYFHKARTLAESGDNGAAMATARTGLARARAMNDAKAAGELAALVDELEP